MINRLTTPPVARLVGFKLLMSSNGEATGTLRVGVRHAGPGGTVHGGILSTLLDTSMTAAVLSTLPMGKSCSTLELKINFVRPVTEKSGLITCRAEIIHSGKRIATASGKIIDDRERLVAHGIGTWTIF